MLTTTKLQRLWKQNRYRALIREVCAGRPEGRLDLDTRVGGPTVAAALGLMRLAELNQTALPLAREWTDRLTWTQGSNGSWEESPMVTALAVRALAAVPAAASVGLGMSHLGSDMPQRGDARTQAVARGLRFLAAAQRSTGGWADSQGDEAFATGVILLELGRLGAFRGRVRLEEAFQVEPKSRSGHEPDAATRQAWHHVRLRLGTTTTATPVRRKAAAPRAADVPALSELRFTTPRDDRAAA